MKGFFKTIENRLQPLGAGRREAVFGSKLAMSLEYIFGKGSTRYLDTTILSFQLSDKTGRLHYVSLKERKDQILFTFRPNGSIAPTISGARWLLYWTIGRRGLVEEEKAEKIVEAIGINSRPRWVVTVMDEVSDVVSRGKTVFSKHVKFADKSLGVNEDVAIMNESGTLLAVGRTLLSGTAMKQFKWGAAVKTRQGKQ